MFYCSHRRRGTRKGRRRRRMTTRRRRERGSRWRRRRKKSGPRCRESENRSSRREVMKRIIGGIMQEGRRSRERMEDTEERQGWENAPPWGAHVLNQAIIKLSPLYKPQRRNAVKDVEQEE